MDCASAHGECCILGARKTANDLYGRRLRSRATPGEREMRATMAMRAVYGIGNGFSGARQDGALEYDASRGMRAPWTKLLLQEGIDVRERPTLVLTIGGGMEDKTGIANEERESVQEMKRALKENLWPK